MQQNALQMRRAVHRRRLAPAPWRAAALLLPPMWPAGGLLFFPARATLPNFSPLWKAAAAGSSCPIRAVLLSGVSPIRGAERRTPASTWGRQTALPTLCKLNKRAKCPSAHNSSCSARFYARAGSPNVSDYLSPSPPLQPEQPQPVFPLWAQPLQPALLPPVLLQPPQASASYNTASFGQTNLQTSQSCAHFPGACNNPVSASRSAPKGQRAAQSPQRMHFSKSTTTRFMGRTFG